MSKLRIRNVSLSSKDNRSYRERSAYHATLRRIESDEREVDARRHVTAWAEQVACRIIGQHVTGLHQEGQAAAAAKPETAGSHA